MDIVKSTHDLILSIPIDNLAIIINLLKSKEIFKLIETYPSIQTNDDLWKKVIFLTPIEHSSRKIGTYFTTYIHLLCSVYWKCDIYMDYTTDYKHYYYNSHKLTTEKSKILRSFDELVTMLAIDIYLNLIFIEIGETRFGHLLEFDLYKSLNLPESYYEQLNQDLLKKYSKNGIVLNTKPVLDSNGNGYGNYVDVSNTYMEKQDIIKKLADYIKLNTKNDSIKIKLRFSSVEANFTKHMLH